MKNFAFGVAAVAMLAVAAAPVQASCTTDYQVCLNNSHDLNVIIRAVADVVCFDDYITCVSRRLLFG